MKNEKVIFIIIRYYLFYLLFDIISYYYFITNFIQSVSHLTQYAWTRQIIDCRTLSKISERIVLQAAKALA